MLELFDALSDEDQKIVLELMKGIIDDENKRSFESTEIHKDSLREGDNQDAE